MTDLEELEHHLLVIGKKDHLGLWFIFGEISDRLPTADAAEVRKTTLTVIRNLLKRGLVEAGFPTSDGRGFEPWSGSAEEIAARIDSEWTALGRDPNIGEVVWLNTTEEGDRAASAWDR